MISIKVRLPSERCQVCGGKGWYRLQAAGGASVVLTCRCLAVKYGDFLVSRQAWEAAGRPGTAEEFQRWLIGVWNEGTKTAS